MVMIPFLCINSVVIATKMITRVACCSLLGGVVVLVLVLVSDSGGAYACWAE